MNPQPQTLEQWLLGKLIEECLEVAHRASKQNSFGTNEVQKGQGLSNKERLSLEIADLEGTLGMIREHGLARESTELERLEKRNKILHYYLYHIKDCVTPGSEEEAEEGSLLEFLQDLALGNNKPIPPGQEEPLQETKEESEASWAAAGEPVGVGDGPIHPVCSGCGESCDPEVCWCGDLIVDHGMGSGHCPVPMGCECGRVKK